MTSTINTRMPVLFISHGPGPAWLFENFIPECGPDSSSAVYLKNFRSSVLGNLPPLKAVLVISAHWEEDQYTVQVNPKPDLLFDYGGPPEVYQVKWPVPGAPEQAQRAIELLKNAGFSVGENTTRGLDHGVFVPLSLVWPDADIPVFQISLKSDWNIAEHLKFGEALAPLRDEGVLIIASGQTTHWSKAKKQDSADFTKWIHDVIGNPSYSATDRITKFQQPFDQKSFLPVHPTMDHYVPMPVASAVAGYAPGKVLYEDYIYGNMLASHFLFE